MLTLLRAMVKDRREKVVASLDDGVGKRSASDIRQDGA